MSVLSEFWRKLSWKFIVAVLVIQGLYWFVLAPFIFLTPNIEPLRVENPRYAIISEPEFEAARTIDHVETKFPIFECCDPVHLSVKMTVNLDEVPSRGLGYIKNTSIDNQALSVNGVLIHREGSFDLNNHTFHGQQTDLRYIPAAILNKGENTLHLITVRSGNPYTDVYAPLVAPYDVLKDQASQRLWIMNEYKLVVASVLLVVSAFGLLLITHSEQRLFGIWLSVLSFAWAASSLFSLMPVWPIGSTGRLIVFCAIHFTLPVALYSLVDSWTEKPVLWVQNTLIAFTVIGFSAAIIGLTLGAMPQGYDLADSLLNWMSITLGILTLGRLLYHALFVPDQRSIELAVLSLAVVALAADAWTEITTQRARAYLDDASPVLLVGLVLGFLSRNFHLFRSASDINATLSALLKDRETELEASYRDRRNLLKHQAHQEERQRIVSDMHDGLGSELMALLVATKRGDVNTDWVAQGLQSIIDEMRLMMDSMESVGESFSAALSTFRDRIAPNVERAGLKLDWQGDLENLPEFEGRDILNIFRILQEAVTNTLKHANADIVKIQIYPPQAEGNELRLTVSDNGQGMPDASKPGRGLTNMQTRARALGGSLDISSTASGVTLSLSVPIRPRVQA